MASQVGPKQSLNSRDGGRAVVYNRSIVDKPQSVEYSRVPSLKTKTETPA
jgi:hypothetical protein